LSKRAFKELAENRNLPFREKEKYIKAVNNANKEKICKLIRLVGMLLQKKVYLFFKLNNIQR